MDAGRIRRVVSLCTPHPRAHGRTPRPHGCCFTRTSRYPRHTTASVSAPTARGRAHAGVIERLGAFPSSKGDGRLSIGGTRFRVQVGVRGNLDGGRRPACAGYAIGPASGSSVHARARDRARCARRRRRRRRRRARGRTARSRRDGPWAGHRGGASGRRCDRSSDAW